MTVAVGLPKAQMLPESAKYLMLNIHEYDALVAALEEYLDYEHELDEYHHSDEKVTVSYRLGAVLDALGISRELWQPERD